MLCVAEPNRRHGIGTALLLAARQRCHTTKLFTSTNESNHGMRSLLQRMNFQPSGVIYNLDPDDPELVFCKD
jgi:GNAT superfamily N-acetyltransferase